MPIRALVVDDSAVVRRTVTTVLDELDDVEVVGTARDGSTGLVKIADLKPDVVTLDVEMPGMNGIETLRHIRSQFPRLPVIMYSTVTESGARATLDALALGAVDYATKPSGATTREAAQQQVRENLAPLVKLWGRRRAAAPRTSPPPGSAPVRTSPTAVRPTLRPRTARSVQPIRLVVIGVSTGGPAALAVLLPMLPATLAVPVVVVQHMPPVFTEMLARRLDQLGPLPVREAVHGEPARPGHVYLAPGGRHLEVAAAAAGDGLTLRLTDGPQENFCRPAVDVLFRTASAAVGPRLLATVLTGMGQDGLVGARLVRSAGGVVLAQDEETSVVWGMPGYVTRDGLPDAVLPLESVASAIADFVNVSRTGKPRELVP